MSDARAVQARFYVSGYERQSYDPTATIVKLQAVTRGEHNKNWAAYTPSGQITMTIKNPGAADFFVERLGKEVSIVITEASGDD